VTERVEARSAAFDDLAIRIHERPELAFEERFGSSAHTDHLAGEGEKLRVRAKGVFDGQRH
jgi:metal-dependent amidase/aminoacylase/carboxypeptidase family protein